MNTLSSTTPAAPTHHARPAMAAIVGFAAIAPAVLMMAPAVASQLASQLQLGPVDIGKLFSAELGAMSLATLPAFFWLPRVNWRSAAWLAVAVFIAANLLSATTVSYPLLLGLRFVSALAGGSLMILCLSAAATLPNPDRAYGLWVMGQLALGAVGLVAMPSLFARFGIAACYVGLALLMALCTPLVRCFPMGQQATAQQAVQSAPGRRRGHAALGILATLAFYISLSGVWTFVGQIAQQAGIDPQQSGNIFAIATLLGVAGAGSASLIGRRLPRSRLLLAGFTMMMAAMLLLLNAPALARFATAALLFKFSWTFILPFILATLADIDHSGKLMNATNLVIGGGLAIGPALAGQLIAANHGSLHVLLLLATLVAAISLALLLLLQQRPTTPAHA
ncbi:MFS transporter [Aquitalea sp. LB_tupeE]|uniref:MFS transporter n=1 Tax=Aquitalea sp. LB_tupeE TaxID=2748078 RepID=UPI0015BD07AC|nr:MFS transporter [Aquitalea sp. LB_tupeE]NWK79354.1 MFS transporter [Aquitalea sp. LB_tupeE]